MTIRYRDYQLELQPAWLQNRWGSAWATSFGLVKDGIADSAAQASIVSCVSRAPLDALPVIGTDRNIDRVSLDTDATFRTALGDAWNSWPNAGTDVGLVNAFARIGLTARIRRNNQWDYDGHPGNVAGYWARLWVIIEQPHSFTVAGTWGSGIAWGSGRRWSMEGTEDQGSLARLVRKWKAAHAQCVNIIVVFSGTLWGGGSTWGSGRTWGGSAVYLTV